MGRTTPITISDEEQPVEGATKDTDEPRQTAAGVEPTVTTEGETIAVTEEQPPNEDGVTTEVDVAADHPVDTSDKQNTEVQVEQQESKKSVAGEPVHQEQMRVEESGQPLQPESDKAVGTEQQQNEAPLDPLEQSLLDILDED